MGLGNVANTAQVTSVTGTAPIASSGGTTPAISIATANTSTTGALTSTDWNTFNNKAPTASPTFSGTGSIPALGVGTTSISEVLDVVGTASTAKGVLYVQNNASTSGYTNAMCMLAPSLLTGGSNAFVVGQANSNGNSAGFNFNYQGSGSSSNAINFNFYGASPLFTILYGGFVGIGNTSPTEPLDVVGSAASSKGVVYIQNNVTTSGYTNSLCMIAPNLQTGGNNAFVVGQANSNGNSAGFNFNYQGSGSSSNAITFTFYGGNPLMAMQYGGNIGINTTSPNARLDVLTTSGAQQRWSYDTSNYCTTTVNSTGGVTMAATGSGARFTLSNVLNLPTRTPADNGTGTAGDICWDGSYIYVCTSSNTWKRAALSSY